MMPEDNLPALDDENLKILNSKKIMGMVDEITNNMRESKKTARTTTYYLITMITIMVIIIGGSAIMVAVESGSIDNFFDNYFLTDNINKRIICSYANQNMTYRSAVEAKAFTEIFNISQCDIIDKRAK